MWFFTKKHFLRDLLPGVVDIHNHILPGIDDGAGTLEDTVKMISIYKELGFKSCIATPHTMADYYGNTVTSINEAYHNTTQQLVNTPDHNYITRTASEYMLDDQFVGLLKNEELLFLKDRLLLTELSYFQKPNNLLEVCYNMVTKEIVPILAHPERYAYFNHVNDFEDLTQRGFKLQLNLLSLSGHYGDTARNMSEKLLLGNMYSYIGTDAHRPQHLEKLKDMHINKKLLASLEAICERQQHF